MALVGSTYVLFYNGVTGPVLPSCLFFIILWLVIASVIPVFPSALLLPLAILSQFALDSSSAVKHRPINSPVPSPVVTLFIHSWPDSTLASLVCSCLFLLHAKFGCTYL